MGFPDSSCPFTGVLLLNHAGASGIGPVHLVGSGGFGRLGAPRTAFWKVSILNAWQTPLFVALPKGNAA